MDLNNIEILEKIVYENATRPLRKTNKKYLKKLNQDKSDIAIETINLLHQSNNTILNVNKLLKQGEIVDSATLMRSSMEKIMMAMMIYFDKDYTYEEFKNLKLCGKTDNTRPTKVLENFKLKIKEINPFVFNDFEDEDLSALLDEMYEKLCLYTHSSIVVSMMIEVNKNNDEDLFIAFFYQMVDFLELLLYCCLKYLCKDKKDHVDIICLSLGWTLNFARINKDKLSPEYLNKYKEYLYWNINSNFNDKYKDILEKIKIESKELNKDISNNKEKINEYFTNLLIKK
ncbi:MAG: hypothetical protein E7168_05650 [Firmicutes bacterium]|nr:hypothetical protein [Bacillota bacterium]